MKLIVALARYGGLRVPSEPMAMTWGDVEWTKSRLTVRCVKTERHAGREIRVIPLFHEIRPYLETLWTPETGNDEFVINRLRLPAKSLTRRLLAAVKAAGFKEWPKPFHNLRSTRETELIEQFPPHVVCKWIGHDITVAARHYLQTTDEHFDRRVQKCMQRPAAVECNSEQEQ